MSGALWLQNLAAYVVQIALIAAAGVLLPRTLRLRAPRVLYSYWQVLLAICLLYRRSSPGGTPWWKEPASQPRVSCR